MSAPFWTWEPTAEATGTQLVLTDPYFLLSQDAPMPDLDAGYAASVDSEGDHLTSLRYRNRRITHVYRVVGSSASDLETRINVLQQHTAKTNRDAVLSSTGVGSTLRYSTPSGDVVTFDVCTARIDVDLDRRYAILNMARVTLTFECLPFGRGTEVTLSDHAESTLPYLAFTESIGGTALSDGASLPARIAESTGTTYYVNGSTGSNGNAGTSSGAAWATITYAIAHIPAVTGVSGGITIQVAGAQTYNEQVIVNVGGDATHVLTIVGTGASAPVIQHQGSNTSALKITSPYVRVRNVDVAGSTIDIGGGPSLVWVSTSSANHVELDKVNAHDAAPTTVACQWQAFFVDSSCDSVQFWNCKGYNIDPSHVGIVQSSHCWYIGGSNVWVINCLAHHAGNGWGFHWYSGSATLETGGGAIHCTGAYNGRDGFLVSNNFGGHTIADCISAFNGQLAGGSPCGFRYFNATATPTTTPNTITHCLTYSNNAGPPVTVDSNNPTITQTSLVAGNPVFTSSTDFHISAGTSAALAIGSSAYTPSTDLEATSRYAADAGAYAGTAGGGTGIAGDVPALGRLVVDDDQSQTQNWLTWGLRSRRYDAGPNAALFYQAETRTLQGGGAATSTSAAGYSGTASVLAGSLSTSLESILSTQASGGGAHLTHVGRYRIYARVRQVFGNTGTVTIALEWAVGDFRNPARNATVDLPTGNRGAWELADLGVVNIPPVQAGSQQWEGRVLAKSTTLNDDLHIDYLLLVPADEGSGVALSITSPAAPTAMTARDDFASGTYSGNLASDTAPTGGTWTAPSSPYETDDFAVSAGQAARTAVSDTATSIRYARWLYLSGTTGMTNTVVSVTPSSSNQYNAAGGVVARAVDKDNFLTAYNVWDAAEGVSALVVAKSTTADGVVELGRWSFWPYTPLPGPIRLTVTAGGSWSAGYGIESNYYEYLSGQHADLATGGTLASGYCGIIDWHTSATAATRTYDSFYAYAPVFDAAAFAGQSIQVRHDGVIREDSGGTIWQPVSHYEGDLLLVPAGGAEQRTTQIVVKMSRGIPGSGTDAGIDDLSARLYVTPRYLVLPA